MSGVLPDNPGGTLWKGLRLVKMREADIALGQAGDETYMDIFRDFSLMASDSPEKLSRRPCDMRLSTL
uniref:Uncharacterized protein n=1 Tax=Pyxicephalus adspersus TaxID=30357 RepID=A0AAV3B444_PYXAD|nr:TPA: hypothetical protein GDO54_005674 [Pyxicephalus adspersus]